MKKSLLFLTLLCGSLCCTAETITAHYYGSEIDLSQQNNPCKGPVTGTAEVIVITKVTQARFNSKKTKVQRTYTLPDGYVLKREKETFDSPKPVVLHKLFPHLYPAITY